MPIRQGFVVLLLVFVSLGVYYPSIFAGATSVDDIQMITAYINIDRFDLKALFLPGTSGYYYRPLLGLTFFFDKFAWGMNESFMHLENVIFHTINTVLVYFIAVRAARSYAIENALLPFCAALLFTLHPVNTESVNWISGRTDLLVGIFLLFSILVLMTSLQSENLLLSAAAAASFLLGCFAKEVTVCALPGLLAIVIFHDRQGALLERLRKRWAWVSLLSATAAIYFLFRFFAFNHGDTGMGTVSNAVNAPSFKILNTIRIFLKVSGFYLKKIFFPWPLNFAIVEVSDYYVIAGLILVLLIGYMLYKRKTTSALFLTSVCVAAPALLVAMARLAWTPFAERYLYVSCATFSVAIIIITYQFIIHLELQYRQPLCLLFALFFSFLAYSTVMRNITWQSNVSLFQDALRNSPGFLMAQNGLAYGLQHEGREGEVRGLMLSMSAPEGSKRGGKLVDSYHASIMAADGDFVGAKKLLLRNIDDAGVLFQEIADKVIAIDTTLIGKERDHLKRQALEQEIIGLLLKIHEKTGDPFYFYRIGQYYLNFGNRKEAQRYFNEAYLNSPDGTHYKLAAKKLAEKLNQ